MQRRLWPLPRRTRGCRRRSSVHVRSFPRSTIAAAFGGGGLILAAEAAGFTSLHSCGKVKVVLRRRPARRQQRFTQPVHVITFEPPVRREHRGTSSLPFTLLRRTWLLLLVVAAVIVTIRLYSCCGRPRRRPRPRLLLRRPRSSC